MIPPGGYLSLCDICDQLRVLLQHYTPAADCNCGRAPERAERSCVCVSSSRVSCVLSSSPPPDDELSSYGDDEEKFCVT
jgi:hypothetical protein